MTVLATLSESWLYGCASGAATAAVLPRRLRGCGMLQYRRWQGFGGAVGRLWERRAGKKPTWVAIPRLTQTSLTKTYFLGITRVLALND